jgi:hypothetical protein
MKATVTLVVLLVAMHASVARAASLPVVIEGLNEAAKACGISEPQLESVALRTLGNSQVQPDADAGGWLHVSATVTQSRRTACVARISVQMKAFEKPFPSGGIANPIQRSGVPVVVLCSEGGDYSAAKADFPLEVESAVEYSIKQCLSSLKY